MCERQNIFENDHFLHSHWQMSPSGLVHKPKVVGKFAFGHVTCFSHSNSLSSKTIVFILVLEMKIFTLRSQEAAISNRGERKGKKISLRCQNRKWGWADAHPNMSVPHLPILASKW
jgi:hypothetical protein